MPEFSFVIFAANNLTNPQNPGFLPAEDRTFLSDLVIGDQITCNGGGESAFVTVFDPRDNVFDEARSDQELRDPVTFDGISYDAGQIVTPTYTIIFSGSDGNSYRMTSFNFSRNTNNEIPDAVFWEGNIPPPGTVLTVTSEVNPTGGNSRPFEDFVTCLAAGTLIATEEGHKSVESLTTEDKVAIAGGGFEKVLMVCCRHVAMSELSSNPKHRPVVVSQGALGRGLPNRDLRVSRQHRFFVSSPLAKRMFGSEGALVAAIQLTQLPGVFVDEEIDEVTYYHVLLDGHRVILAEGAPVESLYLGQGTLQSLSEDAIKELRSLFPDLAQRVAQAASCEHIPLGKQQRKLIARHLENGNPILS